MTSQKHPLTRPPIVIDNYSYGSHYTDRADRARQRPRPGGAAGRRHADHPPARRLADASISRNTRRAYLGALSARAARRKFGPSFAVRKSCARAPQVP